MEQVGFLFNEIGQHLLQAGIGHQHHKLLVVALAVAVRLVFGLDHALHLVKTDAQAIYLQKAFQAANDEIAAVFVATGKVARVHHAVVLVALH